MIDVNFNSNTKESVGTKVTAFLVFLFFSPLSIFIYAVTASYLWEWFVVSQFALPSLSLIAAWGLIFTVRFFTHTIEIKNNKNRTSSELLSHFFVVMIFNLFTLGIGYIIHLFM